MPYETGTPRSAISAFFGAIYPVYVRGEAYVAAHRGAEAAVEFEKILKHRGVVIGDPIGALAHLQLGVAYALAGDNNRARAVYGDFLSLWKDADPDIPILKQAQDRVGQTPIEAGLYPLLRRIHSDSSFHIKGNVRESKISSAVSTTLSPPTSGLSTNLQLVN